MKLTCSIIDDEPLAVDLLKSYVEKTDGLKLKGAYNNAASALRDILNDAPNVLFLDIQIPDLNGLEFSKIVSEHTKVIFTTAFEKYALDSYKLNALDYLLKPISYADFLKSIEKANQWYMRTSANDQDSIFLRSEYKLIQIKLNDILFVEGLKDYLRIYLDNGEQPILSLTTIRSMEEKLPSNKFIRVHRSFIVNTEKLKVIERNRIIFGKNYIPISESYKEAFQKFINERMPQKGI